MGLRKGENGQAFRDVFLRPLGPFGGDFFIAFGEALQHSIGFFSVGCMEDIGQGLGYFSALGLLGDIGLRFLLEMPLTGLPRHGRQRGLAGLLQAGMIVADDLGDPVQPTL